MASSTAFSAVRDNKAADIKQTPVADNGVEEAGLMVGEVINASGHKQELDRQFSLLSISAVGVVVGNTWTALGGSIGVALYNGGPPGVIYEFIAATFFYWFVAASLAELASAIPSSGGVYHWASVTAGKYGRACGFFAGFWNFLAWIFASASMSAIIGNQTVQMYAAYHPDFVAKSWHVFVSYLIVTWCCCCVVLFANRALPALNNVGLFFILGGVFITIVVCAVMPGTGGRPPHATPAFVFKDWTADIGYSSNGFVFLMGMLNGAFAIGTPDCISHLAEEIPRPEINIPKALAAQMVIGTVTALGYMIAIFFAISDPVALLSGSSTFPLAKIYRQATGSSAGTVGLLVVIFLPSVCTCIGAYITAGRTLWTLARDNATPFSGFVGRISDRWRNPFNATLICGCICTILGCIYVASSTAFNAFAGSFVVLSTSSYLAAILPHLLSKRANVVPGPFWMKEWVGLVVHGISCLYIIAFVVIFCFPYALPVAAGNMNYSSLITGGLTVFIAIWWVFRGRKGYTGPLAVFLGDRMVSLPNGEKRAVE